MQKISNAIRQGAEAFLRRQNRTIMALAVLVRRPDLHRLRGAAEPPRLRPGELVAGTGDVDHHLLRLRRRLLGVRRLRGDVDLHPQQLPHRPRRPLQHQPGPPHRPARRGGLRPAGGGHEPARRGRPLRPGERLQQRRGVGRHPPAHRGLRLRRLLRGPVRPVGRRDLHQGGRRRRRPGGQGRGGHPRGRPPQPGGDRRPGGRQRRRLRRPWRRPVRVHRRREHRRHDPGRLAGPGGRRGRAGRSRPGSSA